MAEEKEVVESSVVLPKVIFEPAQFEITNWDAVMARIDEIIAENSNLVVTESNESISDEKRKELDEMIKKFARARIDTEKQILQNFDPKKQELMKQEKRMKEASNFIKEQVNSFKEKRAAEKAAERRNKISKIIEEKTAGQDVDPLKIIWDEKWTKNETYKNIEANIDAQVSNLQAVERERKVMQSAVEKIADALDLQPQGYIDMIGTFSFDDIKFKMDKAAEQIAKQKENERLAEEAKQVVEDDVVLDPKQLQSETTGADKLQKVLNGDLNNIDEKGNYLSEKAHADEPTKAKYLRMPEVRASQWHFIQGVVKHLNENGVKTEFIEPNN